MQKVLDDIDLWVKAPDGNTVSFVRKEAGLMNLEKDDLGISNDFTIDEYGQKQFVYVDMPESENSLISRLLVQSPRIT